MGGVPWSVPPGRVGHRGGGARRGPPGSALGELRRATGLLEAVLLALHLAGVAGQETSALERTPVVRVVPDERAGERQEQGTGLAGGEVVLERPPVEAVLPRATGDPGPGDGRLAASGVYGAHRGDLRRGRAAAWAAGRRGGAPARRRPGAWWPSA